MRAASSGGELHVVPAKLAETAVVLPLLHAERSACEEMKMCLAACLGLWTWAQATDLIFMRSWLQRCKGCTAAVPAEQGSKTCRCWMLMAAPAG